MAALLKQTAPITATKWQVQNMPVFFYFDAFEYFSQLDTQKIKTSFNFANESLFIDRSNVFIATDTLKQSPPTHQ